MISLFNYNVFRQTVTPVFISSDIQHVLSRNHSFESDDGFLFEVFPASGSRVGFLKRNGRFGTIKLHFISVLILINSKEFRFKEHCYFHYVQHKCGHGIVMSGSLLSRSI